MKLIKKIQANVSFDDGFVKSSSIIVNKIDVTKTDTSTFSTKAIVFKFSISKIAFIISRKTSQVEKINKINKSNIVSSAASLISFQI